MIFCLPNRLMCFYAIISIRTGDCAKEPNLSWIDYAEIYR